MNIYIKYLGDVTIFDEGFTESLAAMADSLLAQYNLVGGEIGIILTDNENIQRLNLEYRDKDQPTDVLSFSYLDPADRKPQGDQEFAIGDIYVSIDKAREQAQEAGHSLARETFILVLHGMFHLLGYDHQTAADALVMEEKEKSMIDQFDSVFSGGENNV